MRRPGPRTEIVLDTDNFPTDRYVLDGIARERGLTLRWIEVDTSPASRPSSSPRSSAPRRLSSSCRTSPTGPATSPTCARSRGSPTHPVRSCSGTSATRPARCPSSRRLGFDLAAGCTYKYLNGGPGSPAFGYVREDLQAVLSQPIQGWMGPRDVFAMGPEYEPSPGIRRFISGTPAIVGMLAMQDTIAMIAECGMPAVRAKSVALTEFAITLADDCSSPFGVTLASPRASESRGGHVTLNHPAMRQVTATSVGARRPPRLPRPERAAHRALPAQHQLRGDVPRGRRRARRAEVGAAGARRAGVAGTLGRPRAPPRRRRFPDAFGAGVNPRHRFGLRSGSARTMAASQRRKAES